MEIGLQADLITKSKKLAIERFVEQLQSSLAGDDEVHSVIVQKLTPEAVTAGCRLQEFGIAFPTCNKNCTGCKIAETYSLSPKVFNREPVGGSDE